MEGGEKESAIWFKGSPPQRGERNTEEEDSGKFVGNARKWSAKPTLLRRWEREREDEAGAEAEGGARENEEHLGVASIQLRS